MDFLYITIAAVPEGYMQWQYQWEPVSQRLRDEGLDCTLIDSLGVTAQWGIEDGFTILSSSQDTASKVAEVFHTYYNQDVVVQVRVPATVTFSHRSDA